MPILLVINSSSNTKDSASRKLIKMFVSQFVANSLGCKVIERDIGVTTIPHLSNESLDVISSKPFVTSAVEMRKLSDTLIAELKAADIIVFGVPMYNFSIPSTLKAYFDLIVRPGQTIDYTDNGTVGLIKGKKAFVITTGGGDHQNTVRDFQGPYLKFILNYIGISNVTFIRAHKLLWSEDDYRESMEKAIKEIKTYLAKVRPLIFAPKSSNSGISKANENEGDFIIPKTSML